MVTFLKFFDIFKDVNLKIYETIESIYNYYIIIIIIKDSMLRCFEYFLKPL
jgi:hypothetical protein